MFVHISGHRHEGGLFGDGFEYSDDEEWIEAELTGCCFLDARLSSGSTFASAPTEGHHVSAMHAKHMGTLAEWRDNGSAVRRQALG